MRAFTFGQSKSRGISFASGAFAAASLLSMAAWDAAVADPAGSGAPTASEADNQLVRRCELGSKQEHCYWIKLGVQSTQQR